MKILRFKAIDLNAVGTIEEIKNSKVLMIATLGTAKDIVESSRSTETKIADLFDLMESLEKNLDVDAQSTILSERENLKKVGGSYSRTILA